LPAAPAGTFLGAVHGYVTGHIASALSVTKVLAGDLAAGRAPAGHIQGCQDAIVHLETARDFLVMLRQLRLSDVSGMDLSDVYVCDLDLLIGITWTDDTTWPADITGIRSRPWSMPS
jgi:hypothetical protein